MHAFTLSHRPEDKQLTRHVLLDERIGGRRGHQATLSIVRAGRGRHRDPVAAGGLNGTLKGILGGGRCEWSSVWAPFVWSQLHEGDV